MNDISNLRDTIVPKGEQLNAEMLLPGPITIVVSSVTRGSEEQPIAIHFEGDNGRPYKPCKSMRKVLIFAWGDDGRAWVGRSMRLYHDPEVMWAGVRVGGIRISHLSHVERDIALSLTTKKGKKEQFLISKMDVAEPIKQPLDTSTLETAASNGMASLEQAWKDSSPDMRSAVGKDGLDRLKAIAQAADQANAPEPAEVPDDDVF